MTTPHNALESKVGKELLPFYRGEAPDHKKRKIEQIWSWDYEKLEDTHDYIQWLFPLKERSRYNPYAPVLDEDIVREFQTQEELRTRLLKSFKVMLKFYGFECSEIETTQIEITRSDQYIDRKDNWVSLGNHNYLRISRILSSLRILGLENHSQAFFRSLDEVYNEEHETIGVKTYSFWKNAASM